MKAIVICGMPASGKTTVAGIVGERLGLPAMGGGEFLREMARDRNYNPGKEGDSWWDTDEGKRFLGERQNNLDFDKEADRKMTERANKGNVIITSYTAPWLLSNEHAFKVWLEATMERRAERMAKRKGVPVEKMTATLKHRDEENCALYKTLYNIDLGKDKTKFDLEIDTDDKTPGQVADLIIRKIEEIGLRK